MASESSVQDEASREALYFSWHFSPTRFFSNGSFLNGERAEKWYNLFSNEVKDVLSENSRAFFQSTAAVMLGSWIACWVAAAVPLVKDHTFIYYCTDSMEHSLFIRYVLHNTDENRCLGRDSLCVVEDFNNELNSRDNFIVFRHEDGSRVRVEAIVMEKETLRGTGVKSKSGTVIISNPEFSDPECVRAVADATKTRSDVGFIAFGEMYPQTKGFGCLGDIMNGHSVHVLTLSEEDAEESEVKKKTHEK